MVSFQEARTLLLENVRPLATTRCRIEQAVGRVLREEVIADRAIPSFDRVMMDGFALRMADWENGCRIFRVTGTAPAGVPHARLDEAAGSCMEVMTGAPCPAGADGIVPVEEVIARAGDSVTFADSAAPVAGRFIHRAASDAAAGEMLLKAGCRLGSREIGVAASCGYGWLAVSELPKIAVIATGDELVAVDEVPEAHQIRQSNAHSLAAALTAECYQPQLVRTLGDEIDAARPVMEAMLAEHDWILLTGAVSKGGRDFVPFLLAEIGCQKVFHGVAQRPGKPAGCWLGPGGQMIVALPGNPVSALTGLHSLVFPALAAASGMMAPAAWNVAMDDGPARLEGFTRHFPVVLRSIGRAEAADTGNSGDFIGLLKSDGFLTLPPRGERSVAFPYTSWR